MGYCHTPQVSLIAVGEYYLEYGGIYERYIMDYSEEATKVLDKLVQYTTCNAVNNLKNDLC